MTLLNLKTARIYVANEHLNLMGALGPAHTKTVVNINASKRKRFYAFGPSVHTKTMKTLTVNA